ncbi:MAG: RsmB/NOP family class I SAM-dependent RNA methyltransferase [Firmicutes bacterium]|nr:RsmB/NOP family class I SAM-dependent RNA methyltransferase [Bacillota bacterium]
MKSYTQLYKKLPIDFLEHISTQYSPNELERIYSGFMSARPVTLRVNRLKTDIRSVMNIFRKDNIKFERVLWYEDALIIRNKKEKDIELHGLFVDGKIYLQSLSSMIPPLIIQPQKGWKILDLTAAPGSKTTQLASIMGNDGFILANELNPIRAERLKFNIERQGANIVEVRVGDGKRLENNWNEYFDAVLLDAPCSGTGLFSISSPQSYRGWTIRNMLRCSKEQKKLLETAIRVLKTGGVLVYSTCSIMKEENEDNVAWMLENFRGRIEAEKINLNLTGLGVDVKRVDIAGSSDNIILILPTALYEGFFISKFRKIE